ncbi:2'-5' RNA ligase [Clostridium sp. MB40-C1]|uniref:2'-5' RNA ligase n=1 Tax=Clostridium sp. MB40-C1 TaxID=3070996 RepID=UPI0027E1B266|nr:2'-5' RNA ligase [Clostridium sp. MB40-C1]WMJ80147.1 2'-5' RNA ligase [Clostridium sp. MB40-C1]
MKYYLVALFDDKSNAFLQTTQQQVCRKYKLYRTNHKFHIPIQTVIDPDMDKYDKVILDTLHPYKNFKVQFSPNISLDNFGKNIGLRVEKKGYMIRIARKVTETLSLSGFNVKPDYETNFSISLANSNYNIRKQFSDESAIALNNKQLDLNYDFAKVNRLELWKPINNRKEVLIKSYPLREY